ncbi:MAG: type III pantothenate kinase [Fibrobacterota bacterium]
MASALIFSIGNSSVSAAVFDGKHPVNFSPYLRSRREIRKIISSYHVDFYYYVSVNGAAEKDFRALFKDEGIKVYKVSHSDFRALAGGVKEDAFNKTGLDRLAASAGAYCIAGKPVITVDAGTAVTVDLSGESGIFLGGCIFPGIRLQHEALGEKTSALRKNYPEGTCSLPGKDTAGAVRAGVLGGTARNITGAVSELKKYCRKKQIAAPAVFFTGGNGKELLNISGLKARYKPCLVHSGVLKHMMPEKK